jgi:hypothetical protein
VPHIHKVFNCQRWRIKRRHEGKCPLDMVGPEYQIIWHGRLVNGLPLHNQVTSSHSVNQTAIYSLYKKALQH